MKFIQLFNDHDEEVFVNCSEIALVEKFNHNGYSRPRVKTRFGMVYHAKAVGYEKFLARLMAHGGIDILTFTDDRKGKE